MNSGCILSKGANFTVSRVILDRIMPKEFPMDRGTRRKAPPTRLKAPSGILPISRQNPNSSKPLGSSHNDEADLRDVAREAAEKSQVDSDRLCFDQIAQIGRCSGRLERRKALRQAACGLPGTPRLLSSTPFQSSSWALLTSRLGTHRLTISPANANE